MALAFSDESARKIADLRTKYPTAQAACLPTLHVAQAQFGFIDAEIQELVAKTLGLPVAHVWGVVTFYTMYHREKVGKNVLMVCTNVSCMLRGANDLMEHLEKTLQIKPGETT